MPSRFEKIHRKRMSADKHPPVVTNRGLTFFLASTIALFFIDTIPVYYSVFYLIILAMKLGAPIVNWASRSNSGILADVFFLVGFLLPHLPSIAAVWLLELSAGDFDWGFAYYLVGISVCVLLNAASLKKMIFSGVLEILPPKSFSAIAGNFASGILSGASQECLYRGVLLGGLSIQSPIIQTGVSTIGFVGEHYANRWSTRDFRLKDYARQALVSVLCCIAAITTGGFIAPLLLHVGYNSVPTFCDLYHYWLHKRDKQDLRNV